MNDNDECYEDEDDGYANAGYEGDDYDLEQDDEQFDPEDGYDDYRGGFEDEYAGEAEDGYSEGYDQDQQQGGNIGDDDQEYLGAQEQGVEEETHDERFGYVQDQDPDDGPREEYQYNGLNDHRQGDGYGAFVHAQSLQQQGAEQDRYQDDEAREYKGSQDDGYQDNEYQAEDEEGELYVPPQHRDMSQDQYDEQTGDSRGYQELGAYDTKGVYNGLLESYPYSPSEYLQEDYEEERRYDFLQQWNEQHGLVYEERDRWWPTAEELETYDGAGYRRGFGRNMETQRAITNGYELDDERLDVIQWLKDARSFEDCVRAKQD